mgnify:FL=1
MIKRLAIIGYGSIAKDTLQALQPLLSEHQVEVLILRRSTPSDSEKKALPVFARFTQDIAQFWDFSADFIIEAAGQEAVAQYLPNCLSTGADVLISSIGALANADLYAELLNIAQQSNRRILLPSGAIAGLDYIQSVKDAEEIEIAYESRKPVAAWLPELATLGIAPESVQQTFVLFEGSAAEAAKRYPQNLNVAATLALAGIGMDKTRVRVLVDPSLSQNQHHIFVKSEFGEMRLQVSNTPSPNNPKSSWIVAQSIAATVKKEFAQIKIA